MMQPVDKINRIESLNPLRSVCVTAPAGSGKTELLIQRILVLLSRVNNPEEILAITFTRKAAAEMHERIVAALQLAKDSEEPEQDHKRLTWSLARKALDRNNIIGWKLLENPNRLKIRTIDGFCASLTRQMPIISHFGTQPQICTSADKYYRLAARNFLASMEQEGDVADSIMILMAHLDNHMSKVEDLLVSLLERRDQWLVHIVFKGYEAEIREGLELTAQAVIADTIAKVIKEIQPYASDLLPLLDYAGKNLCFSQADSSVKVLAGIVDFPDADGLFDPVWLAVADALLTNKNEWRKTVNVSNGFPSQTQDGNKQLAKEKKADFIGLLNDISANKVLLDLLIDLRHLPASEIPESQWQLLESLGTLLPVLVAELLTVFQQYGEVDYIQVAIAALESLGGQRSPSELLLKLDYQIQHILVDEFQDTSSSQFDLLKKLVDGWDEHNEANPQAPKTLFVVGDGMQSIYGFRAANVGLFLEAKKYGVNNLSLDDLPLSVNFRSRPVLVDWINKTFYKAFPQVDNISRGAVRYESSSAFKPSSDISEVTINGFCGESSSKIEADYIVNLVKKIQSTSKDQTIAILVRSRNHFIHIIPALKKAGLNWGATEIDPLTRYPFISDLLILTRAMTNIYDNVAWAALLRSPFCGLNNSDLHILLSRDFVTVWHAIKKYDQLIGISQFSKNRIQHIKSILDDALNNRKRKPHRVWIEGVWLKLGGASLLTDQDSFDLVDDYFDLLESIVDTNAPGSIEDFENALHKLYASSSKDSTLQLMTIHKAKGLEFDSVILPGLSKSTRGNNKPLLMWRECLIEHDSGLLISPMPAVGDDEDPLYKHLNFEQGLADSLENTRLLYVACTRAIESLHLCFCLQDESKSPSKNTLLQTIWPAIVDSVNWHGDQYKNNEQLGLDFDKHFASSMKLQRISDSWSSPLWKFQNPLSKYYLETDYSSAGNRPQLIDNVESRIIGTIVHLIMEHLVKVGVSFWHDLSVELRDQWLKRLFQSQGFYEHKLSYLITEVARHINNSVNDEKGAWLLSNEYSYSKCEFSLLGVHEEGVNRKVIDRCFVDFNKNFWIVDYKTGGASEGESIADFVGRESEIYARQLNEYKRYIENFSIDEDYNKIRTGLYFTNFPYFKEIN